LGPLVDEARSVLSVVADPRALLGGLFESSPVPYAMFAVDGHLLAANRAYADMFGDLPPAEYNILEDEVAARLGLDRAIRRAFEGERVVLPTIWYDPKELTHIPANQGRPVAIACSCFPLRSADGRVAQVAIAYKDVTAELAARERAEA